MVTRSSKKPKKKPNILVYPNLLPNTLSLYLEYRSNGSEAEKKGKRIYTDGLSQLIPRTRHINTEMPKCQELAGGYATHKIKITRKNFHSKIYMFINCSRRANARM